MLQQHNNNATTTQQQSAETQAESLDFVVPFYQKCVLKSHESMQVKFPGRNNKWHQKINKSHDSLQQNIGDDSQYGEKSVPRPPPRTPQKCSWVPAAQKCYFLLLIT
jgi:hypothetical protein